MTALARAVAATRGRPPVWIVALCGFLARGGIVLLVLPMLPVPSTVGMATFVGPTSVTAAGLTPASLVRIAILVALVVGWLLAGNLVGALTDRATVDAFQGHALPVDDGGPRSRPRLAIRLMGLRLIALLPLIAVVAITARSVAELVYQELILPSDIAAPIVLRVVHGAQLQVVAIALAWLAGEVLGGVAVRLLILEDRSFGRAVGGAVLYVVRHPLTALVATVASALVLSIGVGTALVAIGAAWALLGEATSGAIDGPAVVRATILVVAAWTASALLAAIVAAWRGALWTIALARTLPRA